VKQVFLGRKGAYIAEVPAPVIADGEVLVEVGYSLISSGTEMAALSSSSELPLRQALKGSAQLQKAINYLKRQGIRKTVEKALGVSADGTPTGYSCAGTVLRVGNGVEDLKPGDEVACAGGGKAFHAEVVAVPRNLVVKLPAACALRDAAAVALGSIALQGIRRAEPRIGENIAVIGLGLLGQLTVQFLRVAGCRAFGIDIDSRRVALAIEGGAERAFTPTEVRVQDEIRRLTDGRGVDTTIIAASSRSDSIMQQAMEITRKKGRVVIVGDVGLALKRSPFYEKEIDLLISSSYGPGRYDPSYEEAGLDYPVAYVRWTENSNMGEFLRLLAARKILLGKIIEREFPIEDAHAAYAALQEEGTDRPLGVLLKYRVPGAASAEKVRTVSRMQPHVSNGKIGIAVIGAGNFARATHLPNLVRLKDIFRLIMIVDASGTNGSSAAREFGAETVSTRFEDALDNPDIQAVMICTRHYLHAPMAIQAARAGKAVFVEKPAALNEEEVAQLESALAESRVPYMVGFNRRFSPAARRAREIVAGRKGPLVALYRVNAGFISAAHWTQSAEGGGRLIGEGCHMLDLLQFLVGSARPVDTMALSAAPVENLPATDNSAITIRYSDGSIGTILYTGLGSDALPKEYIELFVDGKVLIIDDFRSLRVLGARLRGWESKVQDKGHYDELKAFCKLMRGEGEIPLPLEEMLTTTRLSFLAARNENTENDRGYDTHG
jgi:predicted dehydrogenase/threonine dehydrogenase-like Zn-dependent dehydrogenase